MGRRLPSNTLSLSQFLLRHQTLCLYRDFLRVITSIDDLNQRKEIQLWIRHDFDDNRHHKQEEVIKMHLSRGKVVLKQLESTIRLAQNK